MQNILDHYKEYGWAVFDLLDPTPVFDAKQSLQKELNRILGKAIPMEEYHSVAQDDKMHIDRQTALSEFFHSMGFAKKIIQAQLPLFEKLIGMDLLVQRKPYLRLTRPFKPQDNIGYHRDTFYGGSPYEVSVWIPYVDLEAKSSLSVMDRSHILSEELFPTTKIVNPDAEVVKGSQKHKLGFLYAPKILEGTFEEKMREIPLKVGQGLLFSLSTLHGSVQNQGQGTRWSTDIRILNALAPVDLSARPDYYEQLSFCPATECARIYFTENAVHV